MSLVSHWEHEYDKVKVRIHGLFTRMEMAWMKLISELEPQEFQAIIKLLQRGHDQAQYVLKNGELPDDEPSVPWELSHGLSILRIGNAAPLPQSTDQLATRVLKDGSLLGCRKWELLDLLWSEALLKWIENLRHHATFGTDPAVVQMDRDVTLAIAGDWGTGPFDSHAPAVSVANQMQLAQADFTIHLGDVYYAGSHSQEDVDMAGWPMGTHGSFTLNSNHEMYSGAHGYFKELAKRFPGQQGTSYFALINDDWLVVGLDSAYASDAMNLYMDGTLNEPQIAWMKGLPKRKSSWCSAIIRASIFPGTTRPRCINRCAMRWGASRIIGIGGICTTASCMRSRVVCMRVVPGTGRFPMAMPASWTGIRGCCGRRRRMPRTRHIRCGC